MLTDYFQFIYINIGHVVWPKVKPETHTHTQRRRIRMKGEKCEHTKQTVCISHNKWCRKRCSLCLCQLGAPLLFLAVVRYSLWSLMIGNLWYTMPLQKKNNMKLRFLHTHAKCLSLALCRRRRCCCTTQSISTSDICRFWNEILECIVALWALVQKKRKPVEIKAKMKPHSIAREKNQSTQCIEQCSVNWWYRSPKSSFKSSFFILSGPSIKIVLPHHSSDILVDFLIAVFFLAVAIILPSAAWVRTLNFFRWSLPYSRLLKKWWWWWCCWNECGTLSIGIRYYFTPFVAYTHSQLRIWSQNRTN